MRCFGEYPGQNRKEVLIPREAEPKLTPIQARCERERGFLTFVRIGGPTQQLTVPVWSPESSVRSPVVRPVCYGLFFWIGLTWLVRLVLPRLASFHLVCSRLARLVLFGLI